MGRSHRNSARCAVLDTIKCVNDEEKRIRHHYSMLVEIEKKLRKSAKRTANWHESVENCSDDTRTACWVVSELLKGHAVAFPDGNKYSQFLPLDRKSRYYDVQLAVEEYFRPLLRKTGCKELYKMLRDRIQFHELVLDRSTDGWKDRSVKYKYVDPVAGGVCVGGKPVVLVKTTSWAELWDEALKDVCFEYYDAGNQNGDDGQATYDNRKVSLELPVWYLK